MIDLATVRPLKLRPGVRYRCFGDGLCCTDMHVLGPVGRVEAARVNAVRDDATMRNGALGIVALRVVDGDCVFSNAAGCSIHAAITGDSTQPATCRRFPFRLVATPRGGRVVTEHRCPCRTMGARPLVSIADAEASLLAGGRALQADDRVGATVRLTRPRRVSIAQWERHEATLIARLAAGEMIDSVLENEPFPTLDALTWIDVAHLYRARLDGSACSVALAWFGDALLGLHDQRWPATRARPWSRSFDRAEARSADPEAAEALFADWIADAIWSLEWTHDGAFDRARAELATRLAVARAIAGKLQRESARHDRAAAEAIAIVELAGAAPIWRGVVRAMSID